MRKLYNFELDYGRHGELDGIFIADEEEVKNLHGKTVYFGECLGKHSDVDAEIFVIGCAEKPEGHYPFFGKGVIEVITDDQDFIDKFEKLIGCSGYNPLSYEREEE